MKKRLLLGIGVVVLAVSVLLVVWQGSFKMGEFRPTNPNQTFIFWAMSVLIFVLMVTLGFILFRELVKIYIARQSNREGSRIRTKLVVGALALSCVPVFCLVLFSFEVLSRSVNRWFTNPVDNQVDLYVRTAEALRRAMQDEVNAQAALLASTARGAPGGKRRAARRTGSSTFRAGARSALGRDPRARRSAARCLEWTDPALAERSARCTRGTRFSTATGRSGTWSWSRRCRIDACRDHRRQSTSSTTNTLESEDAAQNARLLLHHGDDPDHPVRPVLYRVGGVVPGQADQRADLGAARRGATRCARAI